MGESFDDDYDWLHLNGGRGWDAAINKKPNLHGYGHPNPPNERERRHREQRRSRQHHSQQFGSQYQQRNAYSLQQMQQVPNSQFVAQQPKNLYLVNRPLPPIKQEMQSSNNYNGRVKQNNYNRQSQAGYDEPATQRQNQYEQQQVEEDKGKKNFWSKLCCS